jgi:YfiH family protein
MTIKFNFFDKNGGVSTKEKYKSLNCGPKSGDDEKNIIQNRDIVKKFFDNKNFDKLKLFFSDQIHSDKIFAIESQDDLAKFPEADGIVTNLKNIILAITTADCTPILFYEERKNVIGLCHAGWRGAHSNLMQNLINIMIQKYSCDIKNIKIQIGPNIKQNSYQVQKDFYNKWIEESKDFDRFFDKKNDGYYFNLTGAIIYKLIKIRIHSENIYNLDIDTFSNENYFSYRRMIKNDLIQNGDKEFGVNTSAIVIL